MLLHFAHCYHPLKALFRVFAALYFGCAGSLATPNERADEIDEAQIIREVVSDFIDVGLYGDEFAMPSGYRLQNGQDFDDVFMLRGSATPGAATGYKTSDGNDINQRYYPSGGSDLPIYNTGYKVAGGDDVRTKFRRRAFVAGVNPPAISSITSNSPRAVGQTVTMSVTATGPSLNYQWFKGLTEISGATSASYSFTAAGASDSAVYSCNVWNGGGSVRASTKVVVTTSVTGAPAITGITSNSPQAVGSFVTITATATGAGPLSYSWFGPRGFISGANSSSYSFVASEAAQMGTYTCTVSNDAGQASASTDITITGVSAVPVINYITSSVTECWETDTVEFAVSASGSPTLTYQWYYPSGSAVPGATNATLSIQITSTSQQGNWTCTVTNSAGSDSESIYLTVYALPDPPVITSIAVTSPGYSPAYINDTITLTAAVSGENDYCEWRGPSGALLNINSLTYSFTATGENQSGTYTFYVGNVGGSDTDTVSVDIDGYEVTVSYGPPWDPGWRYVGSSVTFSCSYVGVAPVTYQWYKDGSIISGATSSTYSKTMNSTSDSGTYSCTVSGPSGSGTGGRSISIINYPSPSASISGSSTVAVGGGGGGSWNWSVSSTADIYRYRVYISGQTGNWTYPGSGTTSASGTINWTSPLGSPDISSSPGSHTWVCDVEDTAGGSDSDTAGFTVQ